MSKFLKKIKNKVTSAFSGSEDAGDCGREESPGCEVMVAETTGGKMMRGNLDIDIRAAKGLPDTDTAFFNLGKMLDRKDVTDSYVTAYLDNCRILMTSVKDNTLDPVWNERFQVPVCHRTSKLIFQIRDKDHFRSEDIGQVVVDVGMLEEGPISGWHDIISSEGKVNGQLHFHAEYKRAYHLPKEYSIESYFPMRSGCEVSLFSCARNSPFPVQLSDGDWYQPGSCYLQMFKAIVGAERFIYITGWSVWTELHLVRGEDKNSLQTQQEFEMADLSLGDLLLAKANQGVKVLMMVWSEITSGVVGEKGMMGTHDVETFNFFKGHPVECCMVPREVGVQELSDVLNNQLASASYTHHQKSIIVDTDPVGDDPRPTLIAFVGGLDLTDGRYDTPDHPLFSTLNTIHQDDFYQNSAPGITARQGPRQPWQDIHSRLTGLAALDVLTNFTDRWSKQVRGKSSSLYPINPRDFNLEPVTGNWNVQFLRSITDDSAMFGDHMRHHTLTVKKSRKIEDSISRAYVSAIRAAEKFIYIENQYFLGSAYAWPEDRQINCHHTIPAEIAEKIVEKIKLQQEFRAYIVIPLHPEGDPTTMALQEILAWQRRTMVMMYQRVAEALRKVGSHSNPSNYLVFLCLGNRECEADLPEDLEIPAPESKAAQLRASKRFMIYVHSKLMIVDDSMAIVGSANINQRSLAGSRDTEMAVSVHQDGQTFLSQGQLPRGEVQRFRLRLWEEHLGQQSQALLDPSSRDCMDFIKGVAETNWEVYNAECADLRIPGHLLPYPIRVEDDGSISELPDAATFPDTSAAVAGSKSTMLPMKLTT